MLKSILRNRRIAALTLVTGISAFVISGIVAGTVKKMGITSPQIASTQTIPNLPPTLVWSDFDAHEMKSLSRPAAQ